MNHFHRLVCSHVQFSNLLDFPIQHHVACILSCLLVRVRGKEQTGALEDNNIFLEDLAAGDLVTAPLGEKIVHPIMPQPSSSSSLLIPSSPIFSEVFSTAFGVRF